MSDYVDKVIAGVIATAFASITWLVRRVLTNQQEIRLLQEDIKKREEQRATDRETWRELKTEMKELRLEINALYRQK